MRAVNSICPEAGGNDQLKVCDQTGGQQYRSDLGSVTEFQAGGDEIDDDGSEQNPNMMVFGIVDVTDHKSEIKGQRKQDKKTEYDLF